MTLVDPPTRQPFLSPACRTGGLTCERGLPKGARELDSDRQLRSRNDFDETKATRRRPISDTSARRSLLNFNGCQMMTRFSPIPSPGNPPTARQLADREAIAEQREEAAATRRTDPSLRLPYNARKRWCQTPPTTDG
jgi:hypothetical protein